MNSNNKSEMATLRELLEPKTAMKKISLVDLLKKETEQPKKKMTMREEMAKITKARDENIMKQRYNLRFPKVPARPPPITVEKVYNEEEERKEEKPVPKVIQLRLPPKPIKKVELVEIPDSYFGEGEEEINVLPEMVKIDEDVESSGDEMVDETDEQKRVRILKEELAELMKVQPKKTGRQILYTECETLEERRRAAVKACYYKNEKYREAQRQRSKDRYKKQKEIRNKELEIMKLTNK